MVCDAPLCYSPEGGQHGCGHGGQPGQHGSFASGVSDAATAAVVKWIFRIVFSSFREFALRQTGDQAANFAAVVAFARAALPFPLNPLEPFEQRG